MNDPRADRFVAEGGSDYRTPFQLDRDRILYSTSFARLAEVTQVVRADHGHVFHNRLTHSLKVSQLARRMAERLLVLQPAEAAQLGGLDPDVAEAAGLAHDLGHPPFGHKAEETLDRLVKREGVADGFEGNAQSFRILNRLAVSDALDDRARALEGSNATRATLNAVLKYPWLHGDNPSKLNKWGAYATERDYFKWVRQDQPFPQHARSIEAELMDWADDITFASHDLIDFYCSGHIPLEQLTESDSERWIERLTESDSEQWTFLEGVHEARPDLHEGFQGFVEAFQSVIAFFGQIKNRFAGTVAERRVLWRCRTSLISRYVEALRLSSPESESAVNIAQHARDEVEVLKQLTWHYVIRRHDLAAEQHGQARIIETLFDILLHAAGTRSSWTMFPPDGRNRLEVAQGEKEAVVRVVVDYISSMTEKEAVRVYRTLSGLA